ncbi:unnamed protein product, partial [Mesorhabditis spiculigera]
MKKPAFIIDAFTTKRFAGNQAAVCLFEKELPAGEYQQIASEFNLSETAYPVPLEEGKDFKTGSLFGLRWFTPATEVPLCGHATLATSHVLLNEIGNQNPALTFRTLSGDLIVKKGDNGAVAMDFPQYEISSVPIQGSNRFESAFPKFEKEFDVAQLIEKLLPSGLTLAGVAYAPAAKKLIVVLDGSTTRAELEAIPRTSPLVDAHPSGEFVRGVIVTLAPIDAVKQGYADEQGTPFDYVCRYFAPWVGIVEDPATGSAQCALTPFWSRILKKDEFYALQAYPGRGAQFRLKLEDGGRVSIIGNSVTVLSGQIDTA